jgi:beta-lactam-binding protein with PASTA domain
MTGKVFMFCGVLLLFAVLGQSCRQAPEKRSWPELVGKTGEEAKAAIEKEDPSLEVQIVPYGHVVTQDYRTDRVRIYLDPEGRVARPPRIG